MKEIDIEMPDGSIQTMEHPDNWNDAQVKAAIYKHFPKTESPKNPIESQKSEDQMVHDAVVRYGIKDPLVGLLNFGSRGATSAGNLAIAFHNKLGANLPKQEATDFSEMFGIPKEKNLGDTLAQFAGEIAPALAAPETKIPWLSQAIMKLPAWGKYLNAGLGNAITQGGIAASQSPDNQGKAALEAGAITAPFSALSQGVLSGSPTVRNVSRGLGALGAGGLGYYSAKGVNAPEPAADLVGLLGAALGGRGGSTERRVRENMLKGVKGTDYQNVIDAAKRLNLTYVRPGEASGHAFTAATDASVGKSPEGSQLLYKAEQGRTASEENSIENLFGNIFPKKLEEQKNALYKKADSIVIPEKDLSELKDNKIYQAAIKEVETDPVHQEALKGSPKNSIKYLNQVKIEMDKMMLGAPEGKQKTIRATKNELTAISDKVSPDYREARQLAERGIVRGEIEDLFNKKDETGMNLFRTLLSNKRDYNNLQKKFKRLEETGSTPEQVENMKKAQQQLEDMKLVFGRLINTPTARTAASLARQNTAKEGSLTGMTKQYLHKLFHSDKYDVAAVKLITNPKWADELSKLGEITKKDKLIAAFHNLLGKAGAQAVAQ
jgi:hypothetical protein